MSTSESIERFHKITIESPYNSITTDLGIILFDVELCVIVRFY